MTPEQLADYVRSQGGTPCPRCGAFADPNALCYSCTADNQAEATPDPGLPHILAEDVAP